MPWLAAHLRESVVIGSAMGATALLFAVYPLVHAAWAMAALSILLGLALGSVQPMIMSTLHQMTPHHRHGEALGLRAMAINGSSVVMPLLFGSVGALVGVGAVFWIVGATVGLGSPLAWTLHPPSPPAPERIDP
jgi:MFS family permease